MVTPPRHNHVVHNDIQTRGTANAITDARKTMYTGDRGIKCTDKKTHSSTIKYSCRSTCTNAQGSTCTDVSTKSTGVHRSTCSEISNKSRGVYGGTEFSTVNTVVCGSTCVYGQYILHGPKRAGIESGRNHIGTDAVWMVRKGVIYPDALQRTQGS